MSESQHSLFIVIKSKQNLMQSNFHSNSGRRLDGLNPPGFLGTDYSVLSFRITKYTSGLILLGFAGSYLRYTEGILTLRLASVLKLLLTEMGARARSNLKCTKVTFRLVHKRPQTHFGTHEQSLSFLFWAHYH